jgi:hypothetical protein
MSGRQGHLPKKVDGNVTVSGIIAHNVRKNERKTITNMEKKYECIFCGEKISEGFFCSEQCKNLAISEAEEIDKSIEFLFGKKSNYCQKKLNSMLTNHFEVLKSV